MHRIKLCFISDYKDKIHLIKGFFKKPDRSFGGHVKTIYFCLGCSVTLNYLCLYTSQAFDVLQSKFPKFNVASNQKLKSRFLRLLKLSLLECILKYIYLNESTHLKRNNYFFRNLQKADALSCATFVTNDNCSCK